MGSSKQAYKLFNYLYLQNKPRKSDLIIGFGHFDLKIPRKCADLYLQGYGSKILFTGGIGAGTADLQKPEARAFFDILKQGYPDIPEEDILIEDQSTNTGENIEFSANIVKQNSELNFDDENFSAILVANAVRQKRVDLTWQKHYPQSIVYNCPPQTTMEEEYELFQSKNRDLTELILSEIDKIKHYPAKGYIKKEKIPQEILK
jgi:hypothetical protein